MDQCIVCLESHSDTFSRINTQSSEWKECNIQRIIEKHLWWWHLRQSLSSNKSGLQWICRQCWQELSSFHQFYLTVENVHKQQHYQQHIIGEVDLDEGGAIENNAKHKTTTTTVVKLESGENNNNGLFETEDLIPIKRRQKVRKPLKTEAFNFVEVKSEVTNMLVDNKDEEDDEVLAEAATTKTEISNETPTSYSLEIVCEPFVKDDDNKDFDEDDDFDGNGDEDYHVTASETDEDKILIPLIQKTKAKRKYKIKSKKDSKISSVATAKKPPKQKKIIKKEISESKLTKVIKENDDFLTESQHKLECSICNIHLSDFRVLKVHYRNEHNILGYAMCCGRKFYKRGLLVDHVHVHKEPEYFKCQPCNKSFATRRGLEIHVESHKSRERKYKCEECGKSYFKPDIFERHKLLHVPENEKNFQCQQCDKKFASNYLRRQHEDITHNKKYFKICDVCGKSFRDNYSFLRHLEEHTGGPRSWETCEICGKKLTNKYGLRQHIKMRHTAENLQEQICPFCSRVSPNINAHRLHIKYTHTMERKHACHLCDKSFRRPLELKEHLSTHTGEALYTCPHCPRTFISNANMHKHRKIAHRIEWEESRLKKFNESRRKIVSVDSGGVDNQNMVDETTLNISAAAATTQTQSCPENLMVVPVSEAVLNTNPFNF